MEETQKRLILFWESSKVSQELTFELSLEALKFLRLRRAEKRHSKPRECLQDSGYGRTGHVAISCD